MFEKEYKIINKPATTKTSITREFKKLYKDGIITKKYYDIFLKLVNNDDNMWGVRMHAVHLYAKTRDFYYSVEDYEKRMLGRSDYARRKIYPKK